jgi:hypothetical protein
MPEKEIRLEINKVLDHLSVQTLQDILSFLKSVKNRQAISLTDRETLDKILSEDNDLLEKLAK